MDKTKSSSMIKSNPKPISVFYVWYTELCRRLNIHPAPAVKPAKPKCQTVLDFVADRLKIEEWTPVLNALRQDTSLHVVAVRSRIGNCQFLHDIDTEEKAKNAKRKYGCIWTAYVLKQLLKSLSHSLRSTQVLTYLELDGLPLFMQYLEPLLQGLKKNKTLKTLSFANCTIQDAGCQLVCSYLRFTPNIEVLNLSACNLSPTSGEHLAKLIKYQQINRYCETWHSSLRYENPDAGKMRGIKRITINCNPYFSDEGLNFILDELEDDLWVKALDVQKCGLTESITDKIFDIVEYNKILEIVDLRQNDMLSISSVEKVLQILKQRQQLGNPTEFQWCATAVTLNWSSAYSSTSKSSFSSTIRNSIHKTKSAPMKPASSKASGIGWDSSVRKTKTVDFIQKNPSKTYGLNDTKKQVFELSEKLQKEILKRKEIEKKNEELQSELNEIRTHTNLTLISKKYNSSADRSQIKIQNGINKDIINRSVKKVEIKKNPKCEIIDPKKPMIIRRKERKSENKSSIKNKDAYKNCVINGLNTNNLKNNKPSHNVYDILEKILNTGKPLERNVDEDILTYFTVPSYKKIKPSESPSISVSNSQASLYKYMEELKTDKC